MPPIILNNLFDNNHRLILIQIELPDGFLSRFGGFYNPEAVAKRSKTHVISLSCNSGLL